MPVKYWSLKQTCDYLGVSRWTVDRRVKDGSLQKFYTKYGARLMFLRAEVEALEARYDFIDDDPRVYVEEEFEE